jgi:hypothetical protein
MRFMVAMRISRMLKLSMNRGEPVAYIWRNPFRVVKTRRFQPRVASQARQPWALRRNPFGIRGFEVHGHNACAKRNEALQEPSGHNDATASSPRSSPPVEEREKTRAVHGRNAGSSNVETFHEPSNEHAAPTELEEEPRGVGSYRHGAPTELCESVQGPNACAKQNEAFHEPLQFERCCGWSPTQARSVEHEVHGSNAHLSNIEALHEPKNKHAAPTELDEGPWGVGDYRHGAPTELFKMVHVHSAGSSNAGAFHEPWRAGSVHLAQPFQGCENPPPPTQGRLGPSRTGQYSPTLIPYPKLFMAERSVPPKRRGVRL